MILVTMSVRANSSAAVDGEDKVQLRGSFTAIKATGDVILPAG